MANLSQIANVNISLETASIAKASFGIPLAVSPTTAFSERIRKYSSYNAAQQDGLDAQTLKALSAVFSQTPRPNQAWVGRRDADLIDLSVTSADVATGNIYTFSVNGTSITYTAASGDDALDVYTGLKTALAAQSVIDALFTSTVDSEGLHIKVKAPVTANIIKPVNNLAIVTFGFADSLEEDLNAIQQEDPGWYGFALVERGDALIQDAAAWAETQTKLFFACSDTAAIWSSAKDDLASQLQSLQYLRTSLIAHKAAATEYPEMAWMGRCFTIAPGGETWALKSLAAITPSKFSDTEQSYIFQKNANAYEQYAENTFIINKGKVASGEWIDVVRFRDWLVDTIQKNIASLMIRQKKVPYTNGGIALIVNNLNGSLIQGQQAGGIAPDERDSDGNTVPGFRITYPNAADVSADIKATRTLYIEFVALLAGAIQMVQIDGSLTYSYEG
ncbi:DUF3383 family protein [Dryocola sp. BD626]|uniref:DUF3383 family protein n=1 Tax=Dryocola sp. BD626 TaxID=3133273 RepID=UPI003F4FFA83